MSGEIYTPTGNRLPVLQLLARIVITKLTYYD